MEIVQAIILGILEGITEFLPISSTGHLIVATDLIGYKDAARVFTIAIQTGAIMAIIWFYRSHLTHLVSGLVSGDKKVRKFWTVWILATIPAGIFGLLLNKWLDVYAISITVAVALIVGGIIMWLVETYHQTPKSKAQPDLRDISYKQSIKIGLFQVLALIPGISRSGATIIGGMLSGLDRVTATAFSFYLSIPIILVAGAYKVVTEDINTISGGSGALVIGTVAAFFSALFAIKWLLKYVSNHDFKLFAYYRIVLGSILLLLIYVGVLAT